MHIIRIFQYIYFHLYSYNLQLEISLDLSQFRIYASKLVTWSAPLSLSLSLSYHLLAAKLLQNVLPMAFRRQLRKHISHWGVVGMLSTPEDCACNIWIATLCLNMFRSSHYGDNNLNLLANKHQNLYLSLTRSIVIQVVKFGQLCPIALIGTINQK